MATRRAFLLLLPAAATAFPQEKADPAIPQEPEDYRAFTAPPRLIMNARRLRLLRREAERRTIRWEQFDLVVKSPAEMPEPGFAYALYYLASGNEAVGKRAADWAATRGADLRQLALVFDWCQPLLTEPQANAIAAKLEAGLSGTDTSVSAIRSRVLAAMALADRKSELSANTLRTIFREWWLAKMAPALRKNRNALPREEAYAFLEILHTVRDNLLFDMRDNVLRYFRDFPLHRVLSYYPAVFPGPDNLYRIPMYAGAGEPDLRQAALSRAADLSLVAFDTNALENQFVQGWLIQDQYLMRGPFGIPYEFLWANPYQPGLSYYHLPLVFHDPQSGVLLLRSSWEDNATWLSYTGGGEMELFLEGRRSGLKPSAIREPLQIGPAVMLVGSSPMSFRLDLVEKITYYLLNMQPNAWYEIEVDDEELREVQADAGGILALEFPPSIQVGVRLRESAYRRAAR